MYAQLASSAASEHAYVHICQRKLVARTFVSAQSSHTMTRNMLLIGACTRHDSVQSELVKEGYLQAGLTEIMFQHERNQILDDVRSGNDFSS